MKKHYLNDEQNPAAKRFWKEVSEIRIDPFKRVKGIALPKTNKIYRDMNYRECDKAQGKTAYATWRNIGVATWMAEQERGRGNSVPDYIGDFNDGLSI